MSINAEAEFFTIRHMGREEDDDEELDLQMDEDAKLLGLRKKKKKRRTKDLQLPQVEDLKDRLQKHLIEIQKLVGRKYANDDELLTDDDEDNMSSDDDEEAQVLNNQIAELKRILGANERIFKGEDNDDLIKDTANEMDALEDGAQATSLGEKRKKQREQDEKRQKEEDDDWRRQQDEKFEQNLENNTNKAIRDINGKKNTVLQQ